MDGGVQKFDLKLPDFQANRRKTKSQVLARGPTRSCEDRNSRPSYQSQYQELLPTSSGEDGQQACVKTTPTLSVVTPTKEISATVLLTQETSGVKTSKNTLKTWQVPYATRQQECLERRKPLWSWRERQAKRIERQKESRRRHSDSSTVSLHASKPISEIEVSRLLAVNHPNPRVLESESRVKANEFFTSGYHRFISFKPRHGSTTSLQNKHLPHHQSAHHTRLLHDSEVNALVTIRSAEKQKRGTRGSAASASLPIRCLSPTPRAPPASRVTSAAAPDTKRQRPLSVPPVVISFPSSGLSRN